MKRTRSLLLALLLGLSTAVQAQQEGLFSAQSGNWFLRNPAISGWEEYIDLRMGYRRQWLGTPQGPEGYYLTANAPINYFEPRGKSLPMLSKYFMQQQQAPPAKDQTWYRHGIGATAIVQNNRPFRMNMVQGSYAIHFKISAEAKASLGASLGIRQWRVNIDDLNIGDGSDPAFEPTFISEIVPSVAVGLLVYHPNYFLSISSSQVLEENLALNPERAGQVGGVLERHYYAGAGYKLQLHPNWKLSPQAMLRYLPSLGWSNDYLLQVSYQNQWWGSVGYRSSMSSLGGQLGYAIKPWLRLSYAYELSTGETSSLGRHTHEVSLMGRIGVRQYGMEQKYF